MIKKNLFMTDAFIKKNKTKPQLRSDTKKILKKFYRDVIELRILIKDVYKLAISKTN